MSWEEWLEIPSAFDRWVFEVHGNFHRNSAPLWDPAGRWLKMTNDVLLYLQGRHTQDHTCVHTGQVSVYTHVCTDTGTCMLSVMCTHMHAYASHTHTHPDTRRWYAEKKATSPEKWFWISDLRRWASSYLEMEPPEDILHIYSLLLGSGTLIWAELRSFIVNLCGKDIHAYLEVVLPSCGRNACGDT